MSSDCCPGGRWGTCTLGQKLSEWDLALQEFAQNDRQLASSGLRICMLWPSAAFQILVDPKKLSIIPRCYKLSTIHEAH